MPLLSRSLTMCRPCPPARGARPRAEPPQAVHSTAAARFGERSCQRRIARPPFLCLASPAAAVFYGATQQVGASDGQDTRHRAVDGVGGYRSGTRGGISPLV